VPDSTEESSRRRSATTAYADLIQLGQMVQNLVPQGFLEEFRKGLIPTTVAQIRLADLVVPEVLKAPERYLTAGLADIVASNGNLVAWRQGVLLQGAVEEAMKSWQQTQLHAINAISAAEISKMATIATAFSESALLGATGSLAAAFAAAPSRQLRGYLAGLPTPPSTQQLAIGARASRGVASLAAYDATSVTGAHTEIIERAESDVVAPWVEGPRRAREELMRRLESIDPELPELLAGAWEEVSRSGPGALVKLTSCATEVVERVLRALAPNDEVLDWHRRAARPKSDLDDKGRPTYATRARYVLEGKREQRLVVVQVDAVVGQVAPLRSLFQGGKHASAGSITLYRTHLVSLEALLLQLLSAEPGALDDQSTTQEAQDQQGRGSRRG
jgi:hypothetical protein